MVSKFNNTITSYVFVENTIDRCIYTKVNGRKFIILILYVDDIFLTANGIGLIHDLKNYFFKNFEMKDKGETSYVIGIEILHNRSYKLLVSQKTYIDKIIKRFRKDQIHVS